MAYVPDNLELMHHGQGNMKQLWLLAGVDAIATVRGAGFISERAAMLRLALPVPAALTLAAWPGYEMGRA